MPLSNSRSFYAPVNFDKMMTALNQCIFFENIFCLSSGGSEILAFVSNCSANFQLILDSFIPDFKLKYVGSGHIEIDRVHTVIFNLHQIRCRAFFLGHPVLFRNILHSYFVANA